MNYRRRRKAPHTVAADDWLMTYADMITLLLCFFAIFLSVSVPRQNPEARVLKPEPGQAAPLQDVMEGNLPLHGAPRTAVPTAAEADADAPPAPQAGLDRLKARDGAKVEKKGDRITTLEMDSAAFFASGSATLSPEGRAILGEVSGTLKADIYRDYVITVEGHTDDAPIDTLQFPSNWELSTARAAAVVHFFLGQGIQARQLRAAGYADTFPKAPNRDAAGNPVPENQAQNRRVVIKLEKIDREMAE